MIDLGTVRPGSTLRIPFSSFDKDDGSSITMTSFAVGDILVYKDGSTTERGSDSGETATTDYDAKTGKHVAILDLADNTTADFYAAGSEYLVAIDAVTVDAVTTGGWIARFRIGYVGATLDTTIATLASQTSFTLTSGPAEDDALNGCEVIIHDAASAVQYTRAIVEDYTGSTKTVTLRALPAVTFTIAAKDNISVMGLRQVDVTHWKGAAAPAMTGDAYSVVNNGTHGNAALKTLIDAIDDFIDTEVAAIKAKTDNLPADPADASDVAGAFSTVNTKLDTIDDFLDTEVAGIIATLGSAGAGLSGIPWNAAWDAEVQSEATDALNAYDPPTRAEATADADSILSRLRGLVMAQGTIGATGNDATHLHLGGLTYGNDEINSLLLVIFDVSASEYHARWIEDWVDAGDLATVATLPFTPEASVDTYWITSIRSDVTGGSGLDAAGVRAAVGLASANLDTQLSTIDDLLDTEVAAIKAKTDNLPTDPADASDIASSFSTVNSTLTTIAAYLDTEIAAIKAKTDNLPSDPADQSALETAITAVQTAVLAKLPAALTAEGWMKSDALRVGGTAQTGGDLAALIAALTLYASRTVVRGTVGAATTPSTTQFTPSALSPSGSAADQFKGRIIVFDNDTATAALRGQATDITASSAAALPLLTFTALTSAPASGDTFSIV